MSESSGDVEHKTPETQKPESGKPDTSQPEANAAQDSVAEAVSPDSGMPLTIFLHWCKACGICISFCPHKVFTADRDGKPIIAYGEKCTQCAICWLHCPDLAIVSNVK